MQSTKKTNVPPSTRGVVDENKKGEPRRKTTHPTTTALTKNVNAAPHHHAHSMPHERTALLPSNCVQGGALDQPKPLPSPPPSRVPTNDMMTVAATVILAGAATMATPRHLAVQDAGALQTVASTLKPPPGSITTVASTLKPPPGSITKDTTPPQRRRALPSSHKVRQQDELSSGRTPLPAAFPFIVTAQQYAGPVLPRQHCATATGGIVRKGGRPTATPEAPLECPGAASLAMSHPLTLQHAGTIKTTAVSGSKPPPPSLRATDTGGIVRKIVRPTAPLESPGAEHAGTIKTTAVSGSKSPPLPLPPGLRTAGLAPVERPPASPCPRMPFQQDTTPPVRPPAAFSNQPSGPGLHVSSPCSIQASPDFFDMLRMGVGVRGSSVTAPNSTALLPKQTVDQQLDKSYQGTVDTAMPEIANANPRGVPHISIFEDGGKEGRRPARASHIRRMLPASPGGSQPLNLAPSFDSTNVEAMIDGNAESRVPPFVSRNETTATSPLTPASTIATTLPATVRTPRPPPHGQTSDWDRHAGNAGPGAETSNTTTSQANNAHIILLQSTKTPGAGSDWNQETPSSNTSADLQARASFKSPTTRRSYSGAPGHFKQLRRGTGDGHGHANGVFPGATKMPRSTSGAHAEQPQLEDGNEYEYAGGASNDATQSSSMASNHNDAGMIMFDLAQSPSLGSNSGHKTPSSNTIAEPHAPTSFNSPTMKRTATSPHGHSEQPQQKSGDVDMQADSASLGTTQSDSPDVDYSTSAALAQSDQTKYEYDDEYGNAGCGASDATTPDSTASNHNNARKNLFGPGKSPSLGSDGSQTPPSTVASIASSHTSQVWSLAASEEAVNDGKVQTQPHFQMQNKIVCTPAKPRTSTDSNISTASAVTHASDILSDNEGLGTPTQGVTQDESEYLPTQTFGSIMPYQRVLRSTPNRSVFDHTIREEDSTDGSDA